MKNEHEAKRKLEILASRVQGRSTNLIESTRIDTAIRTKVITNREDVKQVLAESLQKRPSEVHVILESHDDSDRLIDDVLDSLKK
jgi:hypothetical protein